ncbi:MAG: DUF3320 domain-containing protein [Chloroflexi bacterium]|nr:DUF3320 domain-containing protein [Chloroflexota bacterium]
MNSATATLEAARHELLDLGLRNPLLNFRPLRARGVEIVDERPSPIHRHLIINEKPIGFLSTGESDEGGLGQPENNARHFDDQLQTPYSDAELQKRLLNTYYSAREYIEEQGVNVLYLALGALRWIDQGSPDTIRRAPLILLPVELFRPTADSRFRLRSIGADWNGNLSLSAKLALDFGLDLPPPPEEEIDIAAYFQQAARAVGSMPDWSVDETAVALGFFSFSKFLMYHDLDPANWPAGQPPAAHPVLSALLAPDGFTQPHPQLDDDAPIDDHIALYDSHQVIDADSSQTLAILDVQAGHNLVIQGPPGTGKSQTIANLIAEAQGQGKTVLFVAEKMAALDVVKRRLDEVGLGDICLELHSHKSTKRRVVGEIARTLKLGQPKHDGRFPHTNALQKIRDHLNGYSRAVNHPIGRSGVSLYEAYGQQLRLTIDERQSSIINLKSKIPTLATWSKAEFAERVAAANELQRRLAQIGVPANHPLWGTQRTAVPDELPEKLIFAARVAKEALRALMDTAGRLAQQLETAVPAAPANLADLILSALLLRTAPQMYDAQTEHEAWQTAPEALMAALQAGQRISQARQSYDQWLIPEAWSQDALALRQGLMAGRSGLGRLFSSAYRRAKNQLAGLCRTALPPTWDEQIGAVNAILDVQREQPIFDEKAVVLQTIFGPDWGGLGSDWERLLAIGDWLVNACQNIQNGAYPASLLRLARQGADKFALATNSTLVSEHREQYKTAVSELHALLEFDATRPFTDLPFAEQQDWLANCHAAAETIPNIAAYNRQVKEAAKLGLQPLVDIADAWPGAANHLTQLLQLAHSSALTQRAEVENVVLQGHRAQHPDETVAQFRDLDTQFLHCNRLRLANEHWQRLPRYKAGGQMGLLQSEGDKKRNHIPIRQLIKRAGHAVQRIKPVFMMSPLSIAAYLPPDSVQFDLVIFDEASQVRPVDAFGAILRGRQTVVVGDNRQLPPTTFFERLIGESPQISQMTQIASSHSNSNPRSSAFIRVPFNESILDLFIAHNAPQRMLRWHYRSRHESLIAVSNQAFYGRKLVVFPSPDAKKRDVGLRYHHLPHTVYQRGGRRTNPSEADAVAAAVMRHATEQPHLTLGVVAFSRGQRQALRQRIELLRRENPRLEPFFHAHPIEPFFVKNLENVQGDERDVILISVGYGRSADGSLTMNFGPLNQDGGERRLNVLITRARQRCEIFTNLTADDINLRRTDARGVVALKQYLQFAQTGAMGDLPPETSSQPAPFENALAAELQALGYGTAQRVGSGPVRVDVAVVGEDGRYALGIECDGDNYFLARSARDRDRIQGEALARLGWRIHRVWSQEWRRNPAAERERLLDALKTTAKDAKETKKSAESAKLPEVAIRIPIIERYDGRPDLAEPRPAPAYARYAGVIELGKSTFYDFYVRKTTDRPKLLNWMAEIVRAEGPIHIEEMRRRMSHAAGYKMMTLGERTANRLVKEGTKAGLIAARGDFLYGVDGKRPSVRNRAAITGVARKFSYIAPEEIQEAILRVVADALGIPAADVPLRVSRLLGFRQINAKAKAIVTERIERLLKYGMLVERRGELFLNEKA